MVENALVDWSRAQFALTAGYHWIFVPLTLGLAVIMASMETLYVIKKDEFLETYGQVLDEIVRHQFCRRYRYGYHPGIRIRNQLEQLFVVRGRHFRCPAGH